MKNSFIEWTDHTFNPWEGCTKVSCGCGHCYAHARNVRFAAGKNWGAGAPRRRTSASNWAQPVKWDRESAGARLNHEAEFYAGKEPEAYARPRVFCASLADWLDHEVPTEWRLDLLDLIRRCHNLDWQLLTKRPQSFEARLLEAMGAADARGQTALALWIGAWLNGEAPANVWIGTSVENQACADERIPELLKIPARIRFLSCEPLLGPVSLPLTFGEVHWVICGGESGLEARPMHPDWARSLRNQCQAAGIPFFFKQWGNNLPCGQMETEAQRGAWSRANLAGRESYFGACIVPCPTGGVMTGTTPGIRAEGYADIGKIVAGRRLDAREWNEFPTP